MSTAPGPALDPSSSDQPPREGAELLKAAERANDNKGRLSPDEAHDALEWFLSDEQENLDHTFQINVGSKDHPQWVDWTIKPVDMERLRKIRKQAQAQGRRRGNETFDETNANIQIVLEGTVYPNLRQAAKQIGTVDPSDAIRSRFSRKPGLIAQISGEIMNLSGYDDDDVREVDAAQG